MVLPVAYVRISMGALAYNKLAKEVNRRGLKNQDLVKALIRC